MKDKLPKSRKGGRDALKSDHIGDHSSTPLFEYNRITDNIFIGTNMCCQTHFDKELIDRGIKADISLEGGKIDQPYGVDFYTWIPIKNHEAPTMDQAELFVTTLDKLLSEKKKVYIHCKNGHGRAPTMVATYFISKGMNATKALAKVKDKRPTIHLDEVQLGFLDKFDKKHNK